MIFTYRSQNILITLTLIEFYTVKFDRLAHQNSFSLKGYKIV